jgi:crossover junction endodeoxyribonuclease RuvC
MPTLDLPKGRALNGPRIMEILLDANPRLVIVESQQCFPKQGGKSNFTTGFGYGRLLGLLEGLEIAHQVVRPKVWQKAMGIVGSGQSKQQAASIALRLWPGLCLLATPRCRVPHDGLADALLMAEWGRRTCQ